MNHACPITFLAFRQDRDLRYVEALGDTGSSGLAQGQTDEEVLGESMAREVAPLKRRVLTEGQCVYQHVQLTEEEMGPKFLLRVGPDRDESGAICGLHGVLLRDAPEVPPLVPDLPRRPGEHRFRQLVEAMNEGLAIQDVQGVVTYANGQLGRILGLSRDHLLGHRLWEFLDPPNQAVLRRYLQEPTQESCPIDVARPSEETTHTLFSAQPILDEHERACGHIVMVMDITEHRRLQDQYRQTTQMEAVGRLAGGVAHDFNNQLTVILGFADLVLRDVVDDDGLRSSISEIRKAAQRAQEVTSHLLAFSRKQQLRPEILTLEEVLRDLHRPLSRIIGESITVTVSPSRSVGFVLADRARLEQSIVNLVVNARDAMPSGGEITISVANEDVGSQYAARQPGLQPGPYVVLTIRDSGTGMDEDTRKRMFEPFFTTKPTGKGTGLGLSMVYGFVKQSNGYIRADSELGRGTVFHIFLPRVAAPAEDSVDTAPRGEVTGGTETLLVVEDDASVRQFLVQVLSCCGYSVMAAGDAAEAMRITELHRSHIDLLVTDVVMPGMQGPELAKFLRGLRPDLKVLYVSGYTGDDVEDDAALTPGENFLAKPFGPDALAEMVRTVLDDKVSV